MYEMFAVEKRKKSVARMLNNAGYRTRKGARFTDTTVCRLIQDGTAKGVYRANHTYRDAKGKLLNKAESEWISTPVEPIISEELWDQCNQILTGRKDKRPPGPKPVHLFAGLLFCECGQKMYVFSRTPKYICSKCKNKIPMEDIEAIFREELQAFFVSKEKIQEHLSNANQHLVSKKAHVTSHSNQLERVQSEMRKVYQLFQMDQVAPASFGKMYKPLEEQEGALAAELAKLQGEVDALEMNQISADEVLAEATNLHKLWPQFKADEKRRVIESIVEKITLGDKEIDITFCYMPSYEDITKRQRNVSGSSPR